MYTDAMRRAFRSIHAPKDFTVDLVDNEHFLVIRADEKAFVKLGHDDKIEAVQYMIKVKKALEDNGAVVLLTRKAVQ
jgi:hypothetical protein